MTDAETSYSQAVEGEAFPRTALDRTERAIDEASMKDDSTRRPNIMNAQAVARPVSLSKGSKKISRIQ